MSDQNLRPSKVPHANSHPGLASFRSNNTPRTMNSAQQQVNAGDVHNDGPSSVNSLMPSSTSRPSSTPRVDLATPPQPSASSPRTSLTRKPSITEASSASGHDGISDANPRTAPQQSTAQGKTPSSEPLSEVARRYMEVLGKLDNPFVQFLRRTHGVPPATTVSIVSSNGSNVFGPNALNAGSISQNTIPAQGNASDPPFFVNEWQSGIGYRYRSTIKPHLDPTTDATIAQVLRKAEDWVTLLYNAMMNVDGTNNKPKSNEMNLFKSNTLDKKDVEATCRLILTAIIHRCVVGFCGHEKKNEAKKDDRKLNCLQRVLAVIRGLHNDKRICRDVLFEDTKITLFVHSPLSYQKAKEVQELGNDRRVRAVVPESERRQKGRPKATSSAQSPAMGNPTVSSSAALDVQKTEETAADSQFEDHSMSHVDSQILGSEGHADDLGSPTDMSLLPSGTLTRSTRKHSLDHTEEETGRQAKKPFLGQPDSLSTTAASTPAQEGEGSDQDEEWELDD